MSNGPDVAAVVAPGPRCPHYHREANPNVPNADPKCPGRCVFFAGHPHPPSGHQDSPGHQEAAQYVQGFCLCDTCHLWVKDWIIPR